MLPHHRGEGSLCRLARLQMRRKKNNRLNPIVCRKSSISVICFTSLFHYIMQIPTRSVWRGMYSSRARQCDSVTVFLPRCSGRRHFHLAFVPRATPSTVRLPLRLPLHLPAALGSAFECNAGTASAAEDISLSSSFDELG